MANLFERANQSAVALHRHHVEHNEILSAANGRDTQRDIRETFLTSRPEFIPNWSNPVQTDYDVGSLARSHNLIDASWTKAR